MSISSAVARLVSPVVVAILLMGPGPAAGQLSDEDLEALDERITKPYFGDPLDDADNRRLFVLTVYNKTNFFIDEQGRYRSNLLDILNEGVKAE